MYISVIQTWTQLEPIRYLIMATVLLGLMLCLIKLIKR